MSKYLDVLLTAKARELGNVYRVINDMETAARNAQNDLHMARSRFKQEAKAFMGLVKESPELFAENKNLSHDLSMIRMTLESYEREDKTSPIEKLLNFHTMGAKKDESFLLSEVYELIGKDDARSLRVYLRDVISMIDPARAASF